MKIDIKYTKKRKEKNNFISKNKGNIYVADFGVMDENQPQKYSSIKVFFSSFFFSAFMI